MELSEHYSLLRKRAEARFGRAVLTSLDFKNLSRDILQRTGESLSASTLKRFWGYVPVRGALSRSSLNRRVTALLGTTPNDYVRTKRLEAAARMLRETPSAMVSEVCYAVGFTNPSYFARCFAAAYGKSPTEWKES